MDSPLTRLLNAVACSMLRGKPSTRKCVLPCRIFPRRWFPNTVCTRSFGASFPAFIAPIITSSSSAFDAWASARRMSPTDTCIRSNSLASDLQWVPLPTQGPPSSYGEMVLEWIVLDVPMTHMMRADCISLVGVSGRDMVSRTLWGMVCFEGDFWEWILDPMVSDLWSGGGLSWAFYSDFFGFSIGFWWFVGGGRFGIFFFSFSLVVFVEII